MNNTTIINTIHILIVGGKMTDKMCKFQTMQTFLIKHQITQKSNTKSHKFKHQITHQITQTFKDQLKQNILNIEQMVKKITLKYKFTKIILKKYQKTQNLN